MTISNTNHINIVGVDIKSNKLVGFGSILICQTVFGKVGKINHIKKLRPERDADPTRLEPNRPDPTT